MNSPQASPNKPIQPLSIGHALLWILCLAALSVGARNFEPGLSLEGILYASMGRQVARTGEWFLLDGGVPDFSPTCIFHPHLGYWILGALFKLAPAEDWSARIVGHCFYVAFLLLMFSAIRRRSGEAVAVWTVVLLWAWYRFSNIFSNVHLDPGMLFFGTASVFLFEDAATRAKPVLASLSGAMLALCALYKGLTALAFLPTLALIFIVGLRDDASTLRVKRAVLRAGLWLVGFLVVAIPYVVAVKNSRIPDFLDRYWAFQMTNRFQISWRWAGLLSYPFWKTFLRDTYYLGWLALPALAQIWRRRALWIPTSLLVTFVLMYAPAGRIGGQYWLGTMPWTAWLIAQTLVDFVPFAARRLVVPTAAFSLAALLVIQYLPYSTHKWQPGGEFAELSQLRREKGLHTIVVDLTPGARHYINASPFFWYSDLRVLYQQDEDPVPKPAPGLVFRTDHLSPRRIPELISSGWCQTRDYGGAAIWLACDSTTKSIGE